MAVGTAEFDFVRTLIRERAGIVLDDGKEYLVDSRLNTLAKQEGMEDTDALVGLLLEKKEESLILKVVDAMTTNETSFFREMHVFDGFRKVVIPEITRRNAATKSFNMWCGAASSGQEPYTLAMCLHEARELAGFKTTFVASDISQEMLTRCREGVYSQLEVNRGLPAPMLVKNFTRSGADWIVKDHLRKLVEFKEVNLIGTWPLLPKLDVVFLRNVLIYFDIETKREIMRKIRERLRPGGYLFLGCAETTLNIDPTFERVTFERGCCYRVPE